MKQLILFLVVVTFNTTLGAQGKTYSTSGLYLTVQNFENHHLAYEFAGSNAKNKLVLRNFFGSSSGYVVANGEKHFFNKNQVYGYRDCQNRTYRLFNGEPYLLVDTACFSLYYRSKTEEVSKGKELVKKDEYFFSKEANGDVMPLTLDNLKNAFPGNYRFHYSLDAYFKFDTDLTAYDKFEKKYKIKSIYNQSLN